MTSSAVMLDYRADGGYRHVARVALPLVLSTSSATIMSFVDRVFLSRYSGVSVAAALAAGITAWTFMSPFMGTVGYTSTFVAQYCGADRCERSGSAVWHGVLFALVSAAILAVAGALAGDIMSLAGHPPEVTLEETIYFRVFMSGAGLLLVSSALSAFFSGRGRTGVVMIVEVAGNLLNVALDYALIFGKWGFPEWGIRGAAVATVAGWGLTVVLYAVLMFTDGDGARLGIRSKPRLEKDLLRRLLRFGLPNGLQWTVDVAAWTAFVWLIGRLGRVELQAVSITFAINSLAFLPMGGFSMATSILVGQFTGAQRPLEAQRTTYSAFFMTFGYMTAVAAVFFLLPGPLVRVFSEKGDAGDFAAIAALTTVLLRFVALYSLFDSGNVIFASAIRGAGDTRFVLYMTVGMAVAVLIVPTYVSVEVLGNVQASMAAATAYVIVTAIGFYLRFRGGRWKSMRVIEAPIGPAKGISEGPVTEP